MLGGETGNYFFFKFTVYLEKVARQRKHVLQFLGWIRDIRDIWVTALNAMLGPA